MHLSFDPGLFAVVGLAGVFDLGFAVFHMSFWVLFQWPASLGPSGAMNAAITQTLNVVLSYCFVIYGGWLIWAGIVALPPHPASLLAGGGFWLLRTALQPMLFPMRSGISLALTGAFAVGAALHFWAAMRL
jgi:hypothetical protein